MDFSWTTVLAEQLDWLWRHQARPQLDGLTDDEYFREPGPGCWSVRPRAKVDPAIARGSGEYVLEHAFPEPEPPPFTTIAWRLGYLSVCLAERNGSHFGAAPTDFQVYDYAPGAAQALAQLDASYLGWIKGVHGLTESDLRQPCGPAEGPFADASMAELILHVNREALHYTAQIAVLRDLYRLEHQD
jgi:DinB family protein